MHELDGVNLLPDDARVGLLTERHKRHDARAWVSTCYINVHYYTTTCHAIDTIMMHAAPWYISCYFTQAATLCIFSDVR
jgi:hypothetical protein